MSRHTFTVVVECEDEDEYLSTVNLLGDLGEITDEQSDFNSGN